MKKIVILGGCGYLGSALFIFLKQKGFKIDTVDLEWFGNHSNPNNIHTDYSQLPRSFFNAYSSVILLGGHSTVLISEKDPMGTFKNNVKNFTTLLSKLKNQKFIYASSYKVYGNTKKEIVNENYQNFSFSNVYDFTKLIIDYFAKLSNVKYYGLRMATVNGYSPNLRTNQILNKMLLEAAEFKTITAYNPDASFSILGMSDFCRSVEAILIKNGRVGLYNIASFISSIRELSLIVAKKIDDVKIKYKYSLSSGCRIDTKKFSREFDFKFSDTPTNIIDELLKNYSAKTNKIVDDKPLNY